VYNDALSDEVRSWVHSNAPAVGHVEVSFEDVGEDEPTTGADFTNGASLLDMNFDPLRWFVEGAAPEGITLYGGLPKMGKTWHLYQLMLAAGSGRFLGCEVHAAPILALMFEDSQRRAQSRVRKVQELLGMTDAQTREALSRVTLVTEGWGTGEVGVRQIDKWLRENSGGVVFIDTLARLMGEGKDQRIGGAYRTEYTEAASLHSLAKAHHAPIIATTHLRKTADADPTLMVSGTTGLTGGVDSIWVLFGDRRARTAQFYTTGRDLEKDIDAPMTKTQENPIWDRDMDAINWPRNARQCCVLRVLRGVGAPMPVAEIVEMVSGEEEFATVVNNLAQQVGMCLQRLIDDAFVERVERGVYRASALDDFANVEDCEDLF
jgi:hypothetical protein